MSYSSREQQQNADTEFCIQNINLRLCLTKAPEHQLHWRRVSQTFLGVVVVDVFQGNTEPSSDSMLVMQPVLAHG